MNYKIFHTIIATSFFSSSIFAIASQPAIANETRGITVTIEAPDIQSTQLPNSSEYYVVDFEDQSGTNSFLKTNGDTSYSYSEQLQVIDSNQFGGANVSKFITQSQTATGEFNSTYNIQINQDQKYFGFWWSAGDPYNQIDFKHNGVVVSSFRTEDLVNFINDSGTVSTEEYNGNPNSIYDAVEGGHHLEPFSFVNVFFNDDSVYDEIVITTDQNTSAFESDNHTFSNIKQEIRGTVVQNTAPIANDDTATVTILNSVIIDVLANDTDPEGDATTIASIDNIFGGNAVIEDNKIVYTADSIPGEFSLTYTVQDAYGKTDSGTVVITVIGFPD